MYVAELTNPVCLCVSLCVRECVWKRQVHTLCKITEHASLCCEHFAGVPRPHMCTKWINGGPWQLTVLKANGPSVTQLNS